MKTNEKYRTLINNSGYFIITQNTILLLTLNLQK